MKLAAATLALAGVAVLGGASAESAEDATTSIGQCIEAVTANVSSDQQDENDNEWNNWNQQSNYYSAENEAAEGDAYANVYEAYANQNANQNTEQAAAQAEAAIRYNLQGLAQALGLFDQNANEEGQNQDQDPNNQYQYQDQVQYQDPTYQYQEVSGQNCMMGYDESLYAILGFDPYVYTDMAATFYELTSKLVKQGGCDAMMNADNNQYNQYNQQAENNQYNQQAQEGCDCAQNNQYNQYNQQAQNNQYNQQAVQQQEGCDCAGHGEASADLVENILRNCQDVYAAAGINIANFDEIEENTDEGLQDLSTCIQIQTAVDQGELFVYNGNYQQAFANLLNRLDINEDELEDEVVTNILLKLAIENGELKKFLLATAAYNSAFGKYDGFYGQNVEGYMYNAQANNAEANNGAYNGAYGRTIDNWNEFFQAFFYSIGIQNEINLEEIDYDTKKLIYNDELAMEEYTCQVKMTVDLGEEEAEEAGYADMNYMQSFLDSASGNAGMTAGQMAGAAVGIVIALAVAAVFALVGMMYKMGGRQGAADKRTPLNQEFELNPRTRSAYV